MLTINEKKKGAAYGYKKTGRGRNEKVNFFRDLYVDICDRAVWSGTNDLIEGLKR